MYPVKFRVNGHWETFAICYRPTHAEDAVRLLEHKGYKKEDIYIEGGPNDHSRPGFTEIKI